MADRGKRHPVHIVEPLRAGVPAPDLIELANRLVDQNERDPELAHGVAHGLEQAHGAQHPGLIDQEQHAVRNRAFGLIDRVQECADDDAPDPRMLLEGAQINRDEHVQGPGEKVLRLEAVARDKGRIPIIRQPLDLPAAPLKMPEKVASVRLMKGPSASRTNLFFEPSWIRASRCRNDASGWAMNSLK